MLRKLSLIVAVTVSGCATMAAGLKAGGGGNVTNDQLAERNKALDAAVSILNACSTTGKPTDAGLIAVSAAASGAVTVDAIQWQGSEEMKACIFREGVKAKLPAYSGPVVSTLWALGTKDQAAPAMIPALPQSYQDKLNSLSQQINTTMSVDPEMGPAAVCARTNLPPDVYAVVHYRVYIFPDGKVVAATPWTIESEGRESGFIDCGREVIKTWSFDSAGDKGFFMTAVKMQKGVNNEQK